MKIILLILLAAIPSSTVAQQSGLWGGPSLGVGASLEMELANSTEQFTWYTPALDGQAGLELQYVFDETWSMRSGAFYDSRGTHESRTIFGNGMDSPTIRTERDVRLNYLELPLMAQAQFGSQRITLHLFMGPSFSLLISSANSDNTAPFDIGLHMGGGLGYSISEHTNLLLDADYLQCFLWRTAGNSAPSNGIISGFLLKASMLFRLG